MTRVGGPGVPLAAGPADDVAGMGTFAFGSWHPGLCQVAFGDGSVRALSTGIDIEALTRLAERAEGETVETLDGLKVRGDGGWALVRPDILEPVVHVHAESASEGEARGLAAHWAGIVREYAG